MVTRGNAPDYAHERFRGHRDRFERLVTALEAGRPDEDGLQEAAALDHAPPDVSGFLGRP